MSQNIFFSWQSDLPAKTNHYFIKDCLERAIKKLNKDDLEVEEPIRIDHDTKDVPGQPTIFEAIVAKIENCTIFVADFSLVGKTENGKRLTNSNVAIEYGVALQAHSSERVINVMNTAYGSQQDLPFDLQHKRWPLQFYLPDGATSEQKLDERQKLVDGLYNALKAIFKHLANIASETPAPEIVETPSFRNPALFFDIEEPIFKDRFDQKYYFHKNDAYAYLKVIPLRPQAKLTAKDMNNAIYSDPVLCPFTHSPNGFSFLTNKYGAVNASTEDQENRVFCLSQIIKSTREIWGVNAGLLWNNHIEEVGNVQYIPSLAIEQAFVRTLKNYLQIAVEKLHVDGEVKIVAGFSGVDGYKMALKNNYFSNEILEESIENEFIIDPLNADVETTLKPFLENLWDECGLDRPDNLR